MTQEKVLQQLTNLRKKMEKRRWTFVGDLWDLDKAIKLVKEGKLVKAAQFMEDWDTDLREQLTVSVWKWVIDSLCPED